MPLENFLYTLWPCSRYLKVCRTLFFTPVKKIRVIRCFSCQGLKSVNQKMSTRSEEFINPPLIYIIMHLKEHLWGLSTRVYHMSTTWHRPLFSDLEVVRWCATRRWKALLLLSKNFNFLIIKNSSRITFHSLNLKVSLKVTFFCLKMIPVRKKCSWWVSNYQKSCKFVLKPYYGSYRCFWNLTQVSHDRWR